MCLDAHYFTQVSNYVCLFSICITSLFIYSEKRLKRRLGWLGSHRQASPRQSGGGRTLRGTQRHSRESWTLEQDLERVGCARQREGKGIRAKGTT